MKDSPVDAPVRFEGTPGPGPAPLSVPVARRTPSGVRWTFRTPARRAWGFGERFDGVDQAGRRVEAAVVEKFCEQGAATYCPVPFFFTELGYSVRLDGSFEASFDLGASVPGEFSVEVRCGDAAPPLLTVSYGTPSDLLSAFARSAGLPCPPPEWAFGPWISANRWARRSTLMAEVDAMERLGIPATVAVLEAWSDEGGFFAWNDSVDDPDAPGGYRYPEDGRWPDPAGMIAELGRRGLKLVLWQAPVCKRLEDCPDAAKEREARALAEAAEGGFLVRRADGTPYAIPQGRWFGGSPVPDFTDPDARAWFLGKRKHLLDMGVAGFKTDGGEFVHEDGLVFSDGRGSRELRSGYAASYLEAYGRFVGPDRVLFSRAGWSGSQRWSVHWAGDQMSTWKELRAQLSAGLSAGLSGFPYWTFDIGGFAGPLPSAELYLRAFALAAFCPLMQWHSEPVYGQFAAVMKGSGGVNDRSPWNMAAASGDASIVPACRDLSRLRMALLPYLRACARRSAATGEPMMRHLLLDHPGDGKAAGVDDQFLLGPDLLVAPVVEEGASGRDVYFPSGSWVDVYSGEIFEGGGTAYAASAPGAIPAYRRRGAAVPLDPAWVDGRTPALLGSDRG